VVDDEPQIRELLAQALRREGYRVTVESDGQKALAAIHREEVHVLLTDLRMPGVSGLDLIQSARALRPEMGSILITAYASTETAVDALRYGADDYLAKPFRLEDLRAVVARVLGTRRMARDQRLATSRVREEAQALRASERRALRDLERAQADLSLSRRDLEQRVRDLEFVRDLTALLAREDAAERILRTTARILASRFRADVVRIEIALGEGVVTAEHPGDLGASLPLRTLGADLLRRAARSPDAVVADAVLGEGRPREALAASVRVGGIASGGITILRAPDSPPADAADRFLLSLVPQALSVALEAEGGRRAAEQNALDVAEGILEALEGRGSLHRGHAARVARLSGRIAERLGMSRRFQRVLGLAARLHDVGEVGIPESVLLREGPLSDAERDVVRLHPLLGARILAPFGEAAAYVRHHHERPDGRGYPDGLRSGQIPLGAGIIGVAEAFDAMTSPRPYRPSRTRREALEEVRRLRGEQFLREPAEALLALPVEAG